MQCSCVLPSMDADVPSAFTEKRVKARKIHKCGECFFEISPNEFYIRSSGIWDGTPSTYKTCMCCKKLRDVFFCDGFVFEELYSDLIEYIWDSRGDVSSDMLLELPDLVRNRVFNMIEQCWEDLEDYD